MVGEGEILLGGGDEEERDANVGGEYVIGGDASRDRQSALPLGVLAEPEQCRLRTSGCLRPPVRGDLAVHERVETGVLEAEAHVRVPAAANVLDRVAGRLGRLLEREVAREAVLDDRREEAVLAAEEVVQRRQLHADPIADRAQRHVLAGRIADQRRRGLQELASCIALAFCCHIDIVALEE
ncbi:Uncharacterised protein [Mycobacteroides abscessus subsp. abscessus]|nr:Uncharacterised protein [Mycobacteroides abscessus subsp. abscessus]